jgi:hypothetical protein
MCAQKILRGWPWFGLFGCWRNGILSDRHGEPEGRRGGDSQHQHHRPGLAGGLDLPPHCTGLCNPVGGATFEVAVLVPITRSGRAIASGLGSELPSSDKGRAGAIRSGLKHAAQAE